MIKINFASQNNFLSTIIKMVTFSNYSHVELQINDICYGVNLNKGVHERTEQEFFSCYDTVETFSIKYMTDRKEAIIKEFMDNAVGAKYDYKSMMLLGLTHRKFSEDNDKWFCSEIIYTAFRKAKLSLINFYMKPERVTPGDLHKSNLLTHRKIWNRKSKGIIRSIIRWFKPF